ncbi:MAG: hypothetical protein H5U21_10055 [Porphyrobacter sp.]|nr:hypothetical protein [Porphyrobacter sp.]
MPLRQLDFALACGCQRVVALHEGAPDDPAVMALARTARSRGMVVQIIDDAHGLLGRIGAADEVLVQTAGLVPQAPAAVEALASGPAILSLPADAAVPAGFERIDRDRAWAGAALLPGSLVERLAELPPDSEASAALLRIALQARLREHPLSFALVEEGHWTLLHRGQALAFAQDGWRRRQLVGAPPHDLTGRLAGAILRRWPDRFPAEPRSLLAARAGTAALLAAALALAWLGQAAAGLALIALAGLAAALARSLARIAAGPFALRRGRRWRTDAGLAVALDLALAACAALAVGVEGWPGRVFPPAVLLIAWRGRPAERRPRPLALLGDRGLLALLLAVAAALGLAEAAVMLMALVFLVADRFAARRGNHNSLG